ncbi:cupin domain-containing protein [Alteromonas ponticola]|uniref:Cupin domain-containing protein n=1 Tax=Alteromonas aquimaris TaxID=2998417 RepID=A0ABT3P6M6_9ALTE|nr:cupin domain-containing protein [Alteromonas aquimaris]MCW8108419.1 cupin domain-containing protein [Alteromonas aquimaris]
MRNISLNLTLAILFLCGYVNASEKPLVIAHENKALEWMPCPDFIPEGCEISILRGKPTAPNLDIYFKVPGDFKIPRHLHTSQERMVLVAGTLEVKYDNHEKLTVNAGEYVYGPAKLPHSAYCHKGEQCVLYIGFVAPLDAMPIFTATEK